MKKLSIITINRNNAEGLRRTIDSVVTQTFKDYEYIVIDGASTDGSVDVIKEYTGKITFQVSEPDTGIYNAMNKGIRMAKGEYCQFLNSGDYLFDTDVLNKVFTRNNSEDLLYGDIIVRKENSERIWHFPEKLSFFYLSTEFLGHSSTFIKRNLFDQVGYYNEDLQIVSDWEFFLLALAKYNCTSIKLNYKISYILSGGISSDKASRELLIKEREKVLNQHFPFFMDDYKLLSALKKNKVKEFLKKLYNHTKYMTKIYNIY